jgi:hypothetical protein
MASKVPTPFGKVSSLGHAPSQTLRIRIESEADEYRFGLLSCPIQMRRLDEGMERTETDLSGEAFYCTSEEPFAPGERLGCKISIPGAGGNTPAKSLMLSCRVRVVRVELKGLEPGFGIAFQFENREVKMI